MVWLIRGARIEMIEANAIRVDRQDSVRTDILKASVRDQNYILLEVLDQAIDSYSAPLVSTAQ
jgi:type IV secretory pathway VirB9-like protein